MAVTITAPSPQRTAIVGRIAACKIAFRRTGVGAAERQQLAALDLHRNFFIGVGLHHAVGITDIHGKVHNASGSGGLFGQQFDFAASLRTGKTAAGNLISRGIGFFAVGHFVHVGADHVGNHVEQQTSAGFLLFRGLRRLLGYGVIHAAFLFINALASGGHVQNHKVDAGRNRAGGVCSVQLVDDLSLQGKALIGHRLRNLIGNGIQNHAGVIEVTADQCLQIRFIVLGKIRCIVKFVLVAVPHIPCLVHQIHAKAVAGLQQGG